MKGEGTISLFFLLFICINLAMPITVTSQTFFIFHQVSSSGFDNSKPILGEERVRKSQNDADGATYKGFLNCKERSLFEMVKKTIRQFEPVGYFSNWFDVDDVWAIERRGSPYPIKGATDYSIMIQEPVSVTGFHSTVSVTAYNTNGVQTGKLLTSRMHDDSTGVVYPHIMQNYIIENVTTDIRLRFTGTNEAIYPNDKYGFSFTAIDPVKDFGEFSYENIPIQPNKTQEFLIQHGDGMAANIDLVAAFDGKDNNPEYPNKLLTYIYPTAATTILPIGVKRINIVIMYNKRINPLTFTATQNGINITPRFHPMQKSIETVGIDLVNGINIISLRIDGTNDSGRKINDKDTLKFERTNEN
jgi:hypothetical protein